MNDKIEIRELSAQELNEVFKENFQRIFSNRIENAIARNQTSDDLEKISERSSQDNRFRLRLGIFVNGNLAGWHSGYAIDSETYYMQNSAILESYRSQGLYSKLLTACLERLKSEGFQVVTSSHHPNNPAVLIPKLKLGFVISGTQYHERFRFLVDLKYFFDDQRRKSYASSVGLSFDDETARP